MLLMCSNGHIYDQVMNEESSAVNGHFYVTNTLTLCHPEIGVSSAFKFKYIKHMGMCY